MKLSLVFTALLLSSAAQAQIAPDGPPQNAPLPTEAPASPALSEQDARQKLSASGYPDVQDLKRSQDGEWSGTATVSGRKQTVRIDRNGAAQRSD